MTAVPVDTCRTGARGPSLAPCRPPRKAVHSEPARANLLLCVPQLMHLFYLFYIFLWHQ